MYDSNFSRWHRAFLVHQVLGPVNIQQGKGSSDGSVAAKVVKRFHAMDVGVLEEKGCIETEAKIEKSLIHYSYPGMGMFTANTFGHRAYI